MSIIKGGDEVVKLVSIKAEFLDDKDEIRLHENVVYIVLELDAKITIHRGFQSDGASIPRLFWRIVDHPFSSDILPAALLHDALYATELFPRDIADRVLRVYLRQRGVPAWRCWAMYLAVRIGGHWVWRAHTAESVAEARQLVTIS